MRSHPVPANAFAEATVAGMLDRVAAAHAKREAIVSPDERLTFRTFRDRAEQLAHGLSALGIGRDDKVAIWLPNRPSWFVTQYACAKLGAVVVALNPRYRAHELGYILGQSDAKALVLADHLWPVDYFEILHEVVPGLAHAVPGELESERAPGLRWVIVDADDEYAGCVRFRDVLDAGREGWGARPHEAERPGGAEPLPDDLFSLLYTSGTTAFPKGAMISHRNCVPHAWNTGQILGLTPADRVLHALPAAGTWGGVNIPLSTWSHGAALVLMETFDPVVALTLVARERCTVWNSVDTMMRPVLDLPDLERFDRSSLRTGGFGATGGGGHGMFDAVIDRVGIPLAYQPYGMTEVNALALTHDLDEPREIRAVSGSRSVPGIDVRVVHPETGEPCTLDEEGELQFRGELVTRGYYRKPEETRAAFTDDGWFRSGDLGVRTSHGYVFFRGRLREVLRISHFMVAPGEIETFLMSHPRVHQAFVVGVPDPRTNEAAVAYVIPKPGERPTEDELQAFCRGRIASFKIPRVVRFVEDVPRTPSPHGEKVQRGKLREQALRDLGLAAAPDASST